MRLLGYSVKHRENQTFANFVQRGVSHANELGFSVLFLINPLTNKRFDIRLPSIHQY